MEWYYIVLITLLSLIAIYIIFSFVIAIYFTKIIIHPYCAPYEEAFQKSINASKFTLDEYEIYFHREDFTIKSKYGYNLKAMYIPKQVGVNFKDNKERVVVLSHGWTSSKFAMLGYAKIYLNLGFHVFVYDHRNHLESDKICTTMGDKEADDLQTVIEVVKQRLGANIIIGTHGESMGAATVMVHAGRYHSVDFVVEDCGYNTLKELLSYLCGFYKKVPVFPTMLFVSLLFKLLTKTSFKDVNPEFEISTCDDIPMCFMHGDKDDFVPTYMAYKLYDNKPGFKMIHLYKDAKHALSHVENKIQYEKDVVEFLQKINII